MLTMALIVGTRPKVILIKRRRIRRKKRRRRRIPIEAILSYLSTISIVYS